MRQVPDISWFDVASTEIKNSEEMSDEDMWDQVIFLFEYY